MNTDNTIRRFSSHLMKLKEYIKRANPYDMTTQIGQELEFMTKLCDEYIENELDFHEIADHLFIPIHITDSTTKILYVNSAYEKLSGLHAGEILGRTTMELEGVFYQGSVSERVVREGRRITSVAQCFGSGKENMVVGTPVFDEAGKVKLAVVNNLDFPELLGMQEELKSLEEKSAKAQIELDYLRKKITGDEFVLYKSDSMTEAVHTAEKVASTDVTVLITGETGTGKELLADFIYQNSNRVNQPFIKLNCSAIPFELLESELFGYETGAFTGAKKGGKPGMFELANRGTILLDEIGDIPFSMQSKLLRVLQERVVRRIGGTKDTELDIRVIAATNKNLKDAVQQGSFREDLYYRLNVVPIELAPLRERKEDIPYLVNDFCKRFCQKYKKTMQIAEGGMEALMEYHWPGNIRELENLIERLVVTNDAGTLQVSHINIALGRTETDLNLDMGNLKLAVRAYEQRLITAAIERHGSIRKAALALGVDHSTLIKKIHRKKEQNGDIL